MTPVVRILSVVGWEMFQHYKDRDPPWIKLYRDILTTEAWVMGTDISRLVQVAITLLAARYKNKITLDARLIKKVCCLDCSESDLLAAITHLISHKFLSVQEDVEGSKQPDSAVLASCTSETETETETETEQSRQEAPAVAGLDLQAWDRWLDYRKQLGKPVKRVSIPAAQRKLAAHGTSQAQVVENSIAEGYQGLFPPKALNGAARKPFVPSFTTAELEAQEASRGVT